jgi:hypothetical protein
MLVQERIKKCDVCDSENIKFLPNHLHEDLETGNDVMHDCILCIDCESLHYIVKNDIVLVEFHPNNTWESQVRIEDYYR